LSQTNQKTYQNKQQIRAAQVFQSASNNVATNLDCGEHHRSGYGPKKRETSPPKKHPTHPVAPKRWWRDVPVAHPYRNQILISAQFREAWNLNHIVAAFAKRQSSTHSSVSDILLKFANAALTFRSHSTLLAAFLDKASLLG